MDGWTNVGLLRGPQSTVPLVAALVVSRQAFTSHSVRLRGLRERRQLLSSRNSE